VQNTLCLSSLSVAIAISSAYGYTWCDLPATGESQSVVPVVFVEKSDLQIGDELGGQVYRTRWISRNMTVALKRLTGGLKDGEVELYVFIEVYSVIPLPILTFPCVGF